MAKKQKNTKYEENLEKLREIFSGKRKCQNAKELEELIDDVARESYEGKEDDFAKLTFNKKLYEAQYAMSGLPYWKMLENIVKTASDENLENGWKLDKHYLPEWDVDKDQVTSKTLLNLLAANQKNIKQSIKNALKQKPNATKITIELGDKYHLKFKKDIQKDFQMRLNNFLKYLDDNKFSSCDELIKKIENIAELIPLAKKNKMFEKKFFYINSYDHDKILGKKLLDRETNLQKVVEEMGFKLFEKRLPDWCKLPNLQDITAKTLYDYLLATTDRHIKYTINTGLKKHKNARTITMTITIDQKYYVKIKKTQSGKGTVPKK